MLGFPRKIPISLKPSRGKGFQEMISEALKYTKGDDDQSATRDVGEPIRALYLKSTR